MKIDTLVVLYNPKEEYLSYYIPLFTFSEHVIFVDNSTSYNESLISELKKYSNFIYISLHGNQGVAKALKEGTKLAIKNSADYLLTLDQDSIFPINKIDEIKEILIKHEKENYGIIGLNFNSNERGNEIQDKRWWLTSGNFINLEAYKKLKVGFREELFIDGVDTDIGYQFHQIDYKVGYIKGISLIHNMGDPKKIGFGKLSFTLLNYSPIRYYYIFRNINYLYSLDSKFFKVDKRNIDWKMYLKVLFFEKNKKKNLKAISLGRKDAKNNVLGRCSYDKFFNR